MSKYENIAQRIDEPSADFEAFYADMCQRIPALKGRGAIEIQSNGFKKALKAAYLAGDQDAMMRLLNSPDSQT